MRNSALLLIFLYIFFLGAATAAAGRGPLLGGYSKIKNLKDPHILDVGKFAVTENNKKTGGKLAFLRLVSGKQQVVAGMNYNLVIEATDGSAKRKYEAVVYERAWENIMSLTSFKKLKWK